MDSLTNPIILKCVRYTYACIFLCIDIILIHIISGKKITSSNRIRDNIAHGTEENMNFMSLSVQFSSVQLLRRV